MTEEVISENLPQIIESTSLEDIKELFRQGVSAYRYGLFEDSAEIFQNIISTNPEIPEVYANLGNVFFRQERFEEAIDCWKKAINIDASHVSCYVNIGNAYYAADNIDEAMRYWFEALAIAPDHGTALMNIGAAYEKLNDKSNALKYFEQLLIFAGNSRMQEYKNVQVKVNYYKKVATHNFEVGLQFQLKDKLREAAIAYLKSIEVYPRMTKAHLNMGSICYKAKKYDKAIKFWLTGIFLDPANIKTYSHLAVAYEKLEQYDYAYCMYKRYIENSNDNFESWEISKRSEKIKIYLSNHPELNGKHLSLADEYYKNKQYQESLWEYENFVMLAPEQASIYEAKIQELKDFVNPARKASRRTLEAGDIYYEQKKFDQAMDAYKRCIYLDKNSEYARNAQKKILEYNKLMKKKLSRT